MKIIGQKLQGCCYLLCCAIVGCSTIPRSQTSLSSGGQGLAPGEVHWVGPTGRFTRTGITWPGHVRGPLSRIVIWWDGCVRGISFSYYVGEGEINGGILGYEVGAPAVDIRIPREQAVIALDGVFDGDCIRGLRFRRVEIDRSTALKAAKPKPDIVTPGWNDSSGINIRYDMMLQMQIPYPFYEVCGFLGRTDQEHKRVAALGLVRQATPPFSAGGAAGHAASAREKSFASAGAPVSLDRQGQTVLISNEAASDAYRTIVRIDTWQDEKSGKIWGVKFVYSDGDSWEHGKKVGLHFNAILDRNTAITSIRGDSTEDVIHSLAISYEKVKRPGVSDPGVWGGAKLTKGHPSSPPEFEVASMKSGPIDLVNEVRDIYTIWGGGGGYLAGLQVILGPAPNHSF